MLLASARSEIKVESRAEDVPLLLPIGKYATKAIPDQREVGPALERAGGRCCISVAPEIQFVRSAVAVD